MANVDRVTVVERNDEIVAFGMSSINGSRRILSPIIAREDIWARAVASHLSEASGVPVFVDLDPGDEALFSLPGQRQLVHALAGRAFG